MKGAEVFESLRISSNASTKDIQTSKLLQQRRVSQKPPLGTIDYEQVSPIVLKQRRSMAQGGVMKGVPIIAQSTPALGGIFSTPYHN